MSFSLSVSTALLGLGLSLSLAPAAVAQGTPEQARVSIFFNNDFWGNGVLVSEEWVLTSATLVDSYPASGFTVIAGDVDVCTPGEASEQPSTIDSYIWPTPDTTACGNGYDPSTLENDIALLHLTSPVVTGPFVAPASLPTPGNDFVGYTLEAHGWWFDSTCSALVCTPSMRSLSVITKSTAQSYFPGPVAQLVTDCHLPAEDPLFQQLPSNGSSGAGGYVKENGQDVLAGIISWGLNNPSTGCIFSTYALISTRVSSMRPWIDSVMLAPPPVSVGGQSNPTPCESCTSMLLKENFGPAMIGNFNYALEITGTPGSGFAGLFIGMGPASAGFPFNGNLIYAPLGVSFWHWNGFVPVSAGPCAGSAVFPIPIPSDPSLIGKQFTPQGLFVCPNLVDMTATNALTITIS